MKKLLLIAGLLALNPAQSSEPFYFRSLLLSRAFFAGYYVHLFSNTANRRAKFEAECIEFNEKLKRLEKLAPLNNLTHEMMHKSSH